MSRSCNVFFHLFLVSAACMRLDNQSETCCQTERPLLQPADGTSMFVITFTKTGATGFVGCSSLFVLLVLLFAMFYARSDMACSTDLWVAANVLLQTG